jgi:hypothetical protein
MTDTNAPAEGPEPTPNAEATPQPQWAPPTLEYAPPRNPYANRGFVYSIISIFINPLLFLSIIAIVLGARGMLNAPRFAEPEQARRVGRRALTIGIITFVVWGAITGVAITFALAAQHAGPTYSRSTIEKTITSTVEKQAGVTGVETTCPDHAETSIGTVIECDVTYQGQSTPVYATITDANGTVSLSTTKP